MIIYKATNKINGKSYIGQTIGMLNRRKSSHKCSSNNGSNYTFHKAIEKYGWDNFEWEIIEEYDVKDELDKMELYYIKEYDTIEPNGYNMTLYTYGNKGYDFSGKNNPRYGDNRTWEELHGEEKAEQLRKEKSISMKDADHNIWNWKKKNPSYNPMNNSESRKKLSKTRTGGNNPMSIYSWKFTLPSGRVYETDCMREFCRETGFKRHTVTRMSKNKDYKPRDKFYQGWSVEKRLK